MAVKKRKPKFFSFCPGGIKSPDCPKDWPFGVYPGNKPKVRVTKAVKRTTK